MLKKRKKFEQSKTVLTKLPFTRKNYVIFAIGMVIILLGYVALAQGPANNPLSLTVAPILLVIGYCIIIPISIIYREDLSKSNKS